MTEPSANGPPLSTVSADGTTIAYDVYGETGPLVVVVGGATNVRLQEVAFCGALAGRGLSAVAYDRRGRGDSGDTAPYAVQREVEDLGAVIAAVRPGERATAIGFSSGAALVLRAVAGGAPLSHAVVFEPPYRVEGSPPLPARYTSTLERLIEQGRLGEAFEFFNVRAVGMPQDAVDAIKASPMWDDLVATAATLAYDGHCLGGDDHSFPTALVAGLDLPLLALASTGSPPWLTRPAAMVGLTAPHARFEALAGDFHSAPDATIAAAVADFLGI